jgi:hypothetical protein
MLVPTVLVLLVLFVVIAGGIYAAKKRVVDHETPRSDLRPNDRRPQAHPDI